MDKKSGAPRIMSLKLFKKITNGFSNDRKLGGGANGQVYVGEHEGEKVVVKMLKLFNLGDNQFEMYLKLASLEHKNIVKLVGYWHETASRYVVKNGRSSYAEVTKIALCFEYMPNGSLDACLSDESNGHDWLTRYAIIKGICEGLKYLHEELDSSVYHLDLKPANVLLDQNMIPKLADIGLSVLLRGQRSIMAESVVGATDYVPPEYITAGTISMKFDIFSLGAVITKIMTGPTGNSRRSEVSSRLFIELVCVNWGKRIEARNRQGATSVKPLESYSKQIRSCIRIALSCMEADQHIRPSIGKIINVLNETETKGPLDASRDNMASPMVEKNPTTPAPESSFFPKWTDTQSSFNILERMILDESAESTNLPLALLQDITEDFSDERQIGRGGFGVVYKGDLRNGSVAVKRLLNSHTIEEESFHREATSLISVKHQNIVRFLGYCANTENKAMLHTGSGGTSKYVFAEIRERLLCFEYINNGSLDKYITNELSGLEWHTRYQIIRGICDGLVYLHREKSIVHRDMKPANILLDDLMIPKITDFGISKLLEGSTHAVTKNPTGSLGYCAPEYINQGVVSIKSDIYSLGAIIIELLTGCKDDPDNKHVLRRWSYRWNKSAKYPPLGYEQVTKCIEIALRCLSHSPKRRPYVWDIVRMLNELESTNESQVGPAISPYPWELLEFDKLELNFNFEINKPIPCSLVLTNITDSYVAFDIEKAGVLQYRVEPDKGVVPPRSSCDVLVTLQAQERAPHASMCKDEFVVRCATVLEGVTSQDVTDDMFDSRSGKVVDEVTLTVAI